MNNPEKKEELEMNPVDPKKVRFWQHSDNEDKQEEWEETKKEEPPESSQKTKKRKPTKKKSLKS